MVEAYKVGIVILNYNDAETTKSLCSTLVTFDSIDNIVVVDNCSTDDSYDRLLSFKFANVDILKSQKNGGYSYGNNFGAFYLLNNYHVDVVIIANPDVVFDDSFVRECSLAVMKSPFSAVSGVMTNPNGEITMSTVKNSFWQDVFQCGVVLSKIFKNKKYVIAEELITPAELLPGSLFAVKGTLFREIGGFDENLFLYCEERTIADRIKGMGCQLGIINGIEFVHQHAVTINKTTSKLRQLNFLYTSRAYYNRQYRQIGRVKRGVLNIAMWYGKNIRRLGWRFKGDS